MSALAGLTAVDAGVVARLAGHVREGVAADRLRRDRLGQRRLSPADERHLVRSLVADALDALASERLVAGAPLLDETTETALAERVAAAVDGLGRLQAHLDDPDVQDIHVRGADPVWLKRRDGTRECADPVVDRDEELVELVRLAAARAGRGERRFDAASPELNLQLPDGSRLFAVMEVSRRPAVVVRKHLAALSDLGELERRGLIDAALRRFLAAAVAARRNLIVTGGTGTGKTTLLRALLDLVEPTERIVTIEDAYELGLDRFPDRHPDHDALQSRPANTEGRGEITVHDLTRMALRMDPDRVIVGEVRGAEAFPMLLAMSQGNDGSMCTLHADSSRAAFWKLAAYVALAEHGLPVETVNLLVAGAVHFVVHLAIVDGVRRVVSVREVVDADGVRIVSNEVFAPGPDGRARPAAPLRDATAAMLARSGYQHGATPWR
jgi:Flp pilus assembly CpaF family ATPase